ncbi:MAG: CRISPR-associated helicase Cas3' [Syntrophomonadaceae bacterium]|nr:CRISPR-associated helicase Cas3' [Syntrophomonadaceae bacterium]
MSYSCDKLFSHPEKLLADHLRNVGQTAKNWISSLKLNFIVNRVILADIACIIGLAHDLGKSTQSFQVYLQLDDPEEKLKMKNHPETRHSPMGAFCGYYLVREYLKVQYGEGQYADYLPIAALLAIQRHHGDLNSPGEETAKCKTGIITGYINDTDAGLFDELLANILTLVPCLQHCNYNWFEERIDDYDKDMQSVRQLARKLGKERKLDYYFINALFYSLLVDADKSDAAGLNQEYAGNRIPGSLVDDYRRMMGYEQADNPMNVLRNEIYQDAVRVETVLEKDQHILSINVPTGTGKTLNALSVAVKLRELLYSRDNISRSIVYALPFTSIIDQNYHVFNQVFTEVTGSEPGNNVLLKHHYLADGFYKVQENEDEHLEYSPLEARFIIEGWNSSIIVTTFVQLFHSLITNRNAASRKLHRIANAIVILDEVQAVPHRYWQLLRQICNYMARNMDTYFVLVTATLPLIFPEDEIHELVPNKEHYYCALNRIKLEPHIETIIDLSDFQESVIQEALTHAEKDILVVMNTIKSAQLMYKALIEALDADKNEFFYLSSHVVPIERKNRIDHIKQKREKRKIVVSTQLIEAGVDIDLDIVFRDMGPLDSVNQVAGRCNRNQLKGQGVVKLYYIKRGQKPDSSYIYDSTLLNATQKTINACSVQGSIQEKDFYDMSSGYYKLLNQGILSDAESQNVLEAVYSLNYNKIREFKLIDENYEKADIFVEIDATAREIWNRFLNLSKIEDKWQRKEEFYRFKNIFQQYIISVQNNAKWLYPFASDMVGGVFHISLDIADVYYKKDGHGATGLVTYGDAHAIW